MNRKYQFSIASILLVIPMVATVTVSAKDRAVIEVTGDKTAAIAPESIRLEREDKSDGMVTSMGRQATAVLAVDVATFDIPWRSINSGGGPQVSTNYSMNVSIGQSAIGYATSTSHQAGIGYWYGAGGCYCPNQGDVAPLAVDGDGAVDVLDVVALIDEVFRSGPTTAQDAACPNPRGDMAPSTAGVLCGDGAKDVLDVVFAIDHVFRSGPAPCDPCSP